MRVKFISLLALTALSVYGLTPGPPATITLTSSANPVVYGAPITFQISVKGAAGQPMPTGTVSLIDSISGRGITLATQTLDATGGAQVVYPIPTVVGGTASIPGSTITIPYVLNGGIHTLAAVYTGDAVYPYNFTPLLLQVIQKAATSVSISPSQASAGVINLVATVAPTGTPLPCPSITGEQQQDGSPTGAVEFFNGGLSLGSFGLVQGTVPGCVSVVTLPVSQINGTIAAVYSGDGNFTASTFNAASGPSAYGLPNNVLLSAAPRARYHTDSYVQRCHRHT